MTIQTLRAFLLSIPTTKFRIITSVILSAVIVVGHVGWGVQPSDSVLLFVAALAGIDVTQYFVRKNAGTTEEPTTTPQELPPHDKG